MNQIKKKVTRIQGSLGATPFTTTLQGSHHTFISDEPEDEGGANRGPRPHELLLSSLVSCTCITVKMYAMRKEWNLEAVNGDAEMIRVTESGSQTTTVVMHMAFTGNLSDEQRERLLYIASKCPVHKTLTGSMAIEIKSR